MILADRLWDTINSAGAKKKKEKKNVGAWFDFRISFLWDCNFKLICYTIFFISIYQ